MQILTEQDVLRCKDRYLAGESADSIAMSYNVTGESIRRWLRPLGIMRSKDILARDRLTKYSQNESAFDVSLLTPAMAYWAGWLCADGSIVGAYDRGIAFEISTSDILILEKFREYACFDGPISHRIKKSKNKPVPMSTVHITSEQWARNLKFWGVVRRKSRVGSDISKVVQTPFFNLFFRGLFEGDGCIHIRKSNRAFLSLAGRPEVVDLFRCWMWNEDRNPGSLSQRSKSTHVVQYTGERASTVARRLYDGTNEELRLDRKKNLAMDIIASNGGKITKRITAAIVRDDALRYEMNFPR